MDPDPDPPPRIPRKVKYAPKAPPRRKTVSTQIKPPAEDEVDDMEAQEALNRKVKEHLEGRRRKPETKAPVRVAFSHGDGSSSIRTFGRQRERSNDGLDATDSKESPDDMQILGASVSTAGAGVGDNLASLTDDAFLKKQKEYREPWDYENSYYPTTLPLRRPYSGDPELLDNVEFEEAVEYDENSLSSASDLGLLDQNDTPGMLFFKFPSNLPISRRTTSSSIRETVSSKGKEIADDIPRISGTSTGIKGKEIAGSSKNLTSQYPSKEGCGLEELPDGYMGKMLVYKSGAVKLKLGDILYDVSPGCDCNFSQIVTAINTTDGNCCVLGEMNKRAIVTPDIDFLVNKVTDSE